MLSLHIHPLQRLPFGGSRLKFPKILLATWLITNISLSHADTYNLSLASFKSETNAESYILKAKSDFSKNLSIRPANTSAGSFYRVLLGPFSNEQEARNRLATLSTMGYQGAWLLVEAGPDRKQQYPSTPGTRQSVTAAKTKTVQRDETAPKEPVKTLQSNDPGYITDPLYAEFQPGEPFRLTRFDDEQHTIKIDGIVNESIWQTVPVIDDYKVIRPDTLAAGNHKTNMRMMYSDKGLYVSSVMEQPVETIISRPAGRDTFFMVNQENFGLMLDTSGESKYGYFFGITSSGALMDGTMLPEMRMSPDWDGAVYARSSLTDTGWSAEIFVPWGIVTMPNSGKVRTMKVATMRKVAYKDEEWGWPPIRYTGSQYMSLMQPVELENISPRKQWSVYPFLSASYDWTEERQDIRPGADLFWRPSSNLQLDATINPDFGNVESDAVVANLTATETFFPEKRLFFLEGQEIFNATPRTNSMGMSDIGMSGSPYTMVNTRRIGGKPRAPLVGSDVNIPQRELVQRTELIGAVKTTGQIGPFRYGVLGAIEDEVKFDAHKQTGPANIYQDGQDYGVARLLYETSRNGDYRAIGLLSTAVLHENRDALAQGIDWHYRTANSGFQVDGQYMTSDIDGVAEKGYGGFLDFEMLYKQGLTHKIGLEYFDENFDINDLGFLERNDEYKIRTALTWTASNLGWARENILDVRGFVQRSVTQSLTNGAGIHIADQLSMNNLSTLMANLSYTPSFYDDLNSFGNGTFRVDDRIDVSLMWNSDTTKSWQYGLQAGYKEEELEGGHGYTAGGSITWQPNSRLALNLGVVYGKQDGWLLHQQGNQMGTYEAEQFIPNLSLEYYFSAQQQLKLAFSWVGIRAEEQDFYRIPDTPGKLLSIAKPQGPNAPADYDFSVSQYSLQLRYRWEIAPLSDIFLVYTRQADKYSLLQGDEFENIFDRAWREPLQDIFVFKIRYRFGP